MDMKKYMILFAAAAFAVVACGEKVDPVATDNSSVEISETTIVAGPEGGDYTINVTSSEPWRVSGLCDWVTLSAESGQSGQPLKLTVSPIDGDEVKTTVFKVFAGSAVKALTVTLNPNFVIELAGEEAFSVVSDANSFTVALHSNVKDFNIQTPEWITVGDIQEAFGKTLVGFNVKRSSEFKAREAKVTIGAEGVDGKAEINVTQAQRDTAFVEGEQSIIRGLEALDLSVKLRSNIEVKYDLPSWLQEVSAEESEKDDTGLSTKTLRLHADACGGSRAATVEFYTRVQEGGSTRKQVYGSVYVQQQNPNPTFAVIKDANLKAALERAGWILAEPGKDEAEILEDGLTATSLTLQGEGWYSLNVDEISGLGAFPALESLTIKNATTKTLDLTDCKKLKTVSISDCSYFEVVKLGDAPVESLTIPTGTYDYFNATSLTVSGNHLKSLDISANIYDWYLSNYEQLTSLDVTGCPALTTLNCLRKDSYGNAVSEKFKSLYVTAAQKAAYEAGTLSITKGNPTEIIVK